MLLVGSAKLLKHERIIILPVSHTKYDCLRAFGLLGLLVPNQSEGEMDRWCMWRLVCKEER